MGGGECVGGVVGSLRGIFGGGGHGGGWLSPGAAVTSTPCARFTTSSETHSRARFSAEQNSVSLLPRCAANRQGGWKGEGGGPSASHSLLANCSILSQDDEDGKEILIYLS